MTDRNLSHNIGGNSEQSESNDEIETRHFRKKVKLSRIEDDDENNNGDIAQMDISDDSDSGSR